MIHTKAIEIIPLLAEPFDYSEYMAKCKAMGFPILSEGSYAQKLGMVMVAKHKYPHLELKRAYLMFFGDMKKESTAIIPSKTLKKGNCGGNKTEGAEVR